MRCKICGITSIRDAHLAVDSGADALGFILCKSRRRISVERASEILRSVPPFVSKVLVVRNMSRGEIEDIVSRAPSFDTIQFHGDEDEAFCLSFDRRFTIVKVVSVSTLDSLDCLFGKYGNLSYFLLDSHSGLYGGGSGTSFNWDYALRAKAILGQGSKIILAGGLNSANVSFAVRKVMPYAVDVASGVEKDYRHKDPQALRDFMAALREGD